MSGYASFPMAKAKAVRLLVLDVDGVLTDGRIIMGDGGEEYKGFNVRDGHGVKLLQRAGIQVAILTGRSSRVVEHRARDLAITAVVQGSTDKNEGLDRLLDMVGVKGKDCAFMGDDVLDLPPMRRCALSLAPNDAQPPVRNRVDWVSDYAGGHGAVRQAVEGLLLAVGAWERVMAGPYGVSAADCGWHP